MGFCLAVGHFCCECRIKPFFPCFVSVMLSSVTTELAVAAFLGSLCCISAGSIAVTKETYFPEINEMYQRIAAKLQQVSENKITPSFKEKLGSNEKHIVSFLNPGRFRKPIPNLQLGQLPPASCATYAAIPVSSSSIAVP
ncbi:hypothetical protein NC651_007812 [Populus alba x Populus x berolinensis]|nr:hypothetical protein NC651_007812 [Populus alba x Populus x berolinensis]